MSVPMNKLPVRPASREKVYDVLDGERDYQDEGGDGAAKANLSPAEYLAQLEEVVRSARRWNGPEAEGQRRTIDNFRRIGGIVVAAMEVHGAIPREFHVPASAGITGEMKAVDRGDALGLRKTAPA